MNILEKKEEISTNKARSSVINIKNDTETSSSEKKENYLNNENIDIFLSDTY